MKGLNTVNWQYFIVNSQEAKMAINDMDCILLETQHQRIRKDPKVSKLV